MIPPSTYCRGCIRTRKALLRAFLTALKTPRPRPPQAWRQLSLLPVPRSHYYSSSASSSSTTTTTTFASSTSALDRVLHSMDAQGAAFLQGMVVDPPSSATEEGAPVGQTLTGACNLLLTQVAKSAEAGSLDKALSYLSTMRAARISDVPSLAARNELIRACGREIRRLRSTGHRRAGAKAKEYREVAQGLFEELMTGPVSRPLMEEEDARARSMAVSSMIYVECQAQRPDAALAVYRRTKHLGYVPDKWAASGLIKSVAGAGRAEEAVALLEELDTAEGGQGDGREGGVLQHLGLYYSLLSSVLGRLGQDPVSLQAAQLVSMADRVMSRFRARGMRLTPRVFREYLQILASQGNWERVEAAIKQEEAAGMAMTAAEYCPLVEALGVAGDSQRLDDVKAMLSAKGVLMTRALFVQLIMAYGQCEDGNGVLSTWQETVAAGVEVDMAATTALMRALLDSGLDDKAWAVFEGWQGEVPDEIMYSVALRCASATGGIERLRAVYRCAVQDLEGTPSLVVMNALLAGYADEGDFEGAFRVLREIRAKGLKPRIDTFNTLIHALGQARRWGEAMRVAEEAKAEGLSFSKITMRTLMRGPYSPVTQALVTPELPPLSPAGRQRREAAAEASSDELMLDLHGLTVAETNVLLSREFKELREAYEASRAHRRTEPLDDPEASSLDLQAEEEDSVLRDMVIITGIGRRSVVKGQSVLRVVVRDFLGERAIHYYHPQRNRGRVVIPKASFREYFDTLRKKEQEMKFVRLSLYRYLPVASLLVMSMMIPKIHGHFPVG